MKIVEIPFERVSVRFNGQQQDLLRFADLWVVRDDAVPRHEEAVTQVLSNPFIELGHVEHAGDPIGAVSEKIFVRLVPAARSNPGATDSSADFQFDNYKV